MGKYYAVRKGYQPGIYSSYEETKEQVLGFPGAEHKSFEDKKDAEDFMKGKHFPSLKQLREQKNRDAAKTAPNRPKGSIAYVLDRDTGRVVLYVQGVCSDNQTSSIASAATGLFAGLEHPDNQSKPLPGYTHTSNRAHLVALLEAYKLVQERQDDQKYEIRTNSQYAIDCTTVWCRRWMTNGWRNSKRKPVANADVIQDILKVNSAMPGTDKVTLKHASKAEKHMGSAEARKLARKGVRSCRDVLCSCGQVLTHRHE